LIAAARIVAALRERGRSATLDIVGRRGWGEDWLALKAMPGVTLHDYLPDAGARKMLDGADALICTSHEEGLGLPLLEAQYAGLPVIAPEQPVFREVLGRSGLFIDPQNPASAAALIERHTATDNWRSISINLAKDNLKRWNDAAKSDRDRVVDLIGRLSHSDEGTTPRSGTVH